jgi:hypothetical protein
MRRSFPILLPYSIILGAAAINAAHAGYQSNSFVRMIEQHVGIQPGEVRVLTECSCTVKYLGTKIDGRLYTIVLEKLD